MIVKPLRARPSKSHIWGECEGSIGVEAASPDLETDEALEGTAAHWVALEHIQGKPIPHDTPEGHVVTDEMLRGAQLYAEIIRPLSLRGVGHFEYPVGHMPKGAPNLPVATAGTPDFWLFDGGTLYVVDYKFGRRSVSPYRNSQLTVYASHILDFLGQIDFNIDLVFIIVQPRDYTSAGRVKEWRCNGADIRGDVNALRAKATAGLTGTAPTRAGPWCLDCNGRANCETLRVAGARVCDYVGAAQVLNPTPREVGAELLILRRMHDVFEARETGLEALAESMERNGQSVPGFHMGRGRSAKVWSVPDEQVIRLGDMVGHKLAKPAKSITPTQAIDAGVPEAFVKSISKIIPGKLSLQPLDLAEVERIFNHE